MRAYIEKNISICYNGRLENRLMYVLKALMFNVINASITYTNCGLVK